MLFDFRLGDTLLGVRLVELEDSRNVSSPGSFEGSHSRYQQAGRGCFRDWGASTVGGELEGGSGDDKMERRREHGRGRRREVKSVDVAAEENRRCQTCHLLRYEISHDTNIFCFFSQAVVFFSFLKAVNDGNALPSRPVVVLTYGCVETDRVEGP